MAGRRNTIARWRRVKHTAVVLCVQSLTVWLGLCAIVARIEVGRVGVLVSEGGRVRYEHATVQFVSRERLSSPVSMGDYVYRFWKWPSLMPIWIWSPATTPGHLNSFVIALPLWPLPVAFGAVAWYANTRIKPLRQGACTKCGYDTRGLAAGAVCPECGAVQAA